MAIIEGTLENDTLRGSADDDVIRGFAGDDVIDGGPGMDQLFGGEGNDTFKFSEGRPTKDTAGSLGLIDGSEGFDTVDLRGLFEAVMLQYVTSSGKIEFGLRVGSQMFELKNLEKVFFSEKTISIAINDSSFPILAEIYAGSASNIISVNANANVWSQAGDDRISVFAKNGSGFRTGIIDGGEGNDTLSVSNIFKIDLSKGIIETNNTKFYVNNTENLLINLEYDSPNFGIVGSDADNVITISNLSYSPGGVRIYGEGGNDTITGFTTPDHLFGGTGNDVIYGLEGDDELFGEEGEDILFGGNGADVLNGQASNDTLSGGAGNDTIDGGAGFDRASYSGLFKNYSSVIVGDSLKLKGPTSEGADTIRNVEIITFRDGVMKFDADATFAQIIRAYDTVLGRSPDEAGLEFYVDAIEKRGVSLLAVADDLAQSAEFKAATGGLSNEQFVDYVYHHALGRAPDESGANYYTQLLNNGISRGAFVVDLSESPEHRASTKDKIAAGYFDTDETYQSIALLYDGFANRRPDATGLVYYAERVKSGNMTLLQVADDFASSKEFKDLITNKTNGEIVDMIYQNTLDRSADFGGKSFYVSQLDMGATSAGILLDVSLSSEHFSLIAKYIWHGIDLA
ncbi:DUF4214 domain-containing protein [Sphingomonas sp. Leaf67]|uniref:DUF4214 domain-containing protein n=1 Tax=Sphingomonas sp. Leaf67 TaxID=1736230 RepID=UPI0009E9D316|nr:DUF4214 domain-containing protein [Sphingomonas sp. Leaf67]